MGNLIQSCTRPAQPTKEKDKQSVQKRSLFKFVLHGLTGVGKTCMLYRLRNGEAPTDYITTIGIDFQILYHNGVKYQGWDVAGRERSRSITVSYLRGAHGFIYVVDCADEKSIEDSLELLDSDLFQREMNENKVVMVIANKQDVENAVGPEELEERIKKQCTLGLGMTAFVMPCSVLTGEGVQLAFEYFMKMMTMNEEGLLMPCFKEQAWKHAGEECGNLSSKSNYGSKEEDELEMKRNEKMKIEAEKNESVEEDVKKKVVDTEEIKVAENPNENIEKKVLDTKNVENDWDVAETELEKVDDEIIRDDNIVLSMKEEEVDVNSNMKVVNEDLNFLETNRIRKEGLIR